jgi:hypothetical protein
VTAGEAVAATAVDRGTDDAISGPVQGLGLPIKAGEATAVAARSEGRTGVGLLDLTTTTVVESVGDATTNAGPLRRPAPAGRH